MRLASPLLLLTAITAATPDQVRLPVIADTSLQAHPSEIHCNSGGSSHIRIKGNEHFMLLKVDLEPIRGWQINRATLYLHAARPHMLRTVGLSTIAADWQEGTGTSTEVPGGCTFTHAIWPDVTWAGPGSDFLDVALTNGHTLVRYTDVQPQADGWLAVDVDPLLLDLMLCGASYGLCVSDEKGQTMANNDVHSREQSQFAPYMLVEGQEVTELPAPPTLAAISAEPWSAAATFDTGAARVAVTSIGGLCYDLAYRPVGAEWVAVPRYQVPLPAPPGQTQHILISGLRPDAQHQVRVSAVFPHGRRTAPREVLLRASPAKPLPAPLPAPPAEAAAPGAPRQGGNLRVWACPAECKVHPVSGNVLEELGATQYAGAPAGDYCRRNPTWDASGAHVAAARGEVAALQIVVEDASGNDRAFSLHLEGEPKPRAIWRNWYVRDGEWFAEYMVPLRDGVAHIPAADNNVGGQRNQSFTIIWEVPRDAAPGQHRADLLIRASTTGQVLVSLPIWFRVYDFEVPARTSFEVDLNCYGSVYPEGNWERYLEWERKYYAAAHTLRATLNSLGYSHSGRMERGYAPKLEGEGADIRVADWSEYDHHWGPYLDGSAFGGVRAGVPITHMYLPFHENWPSPIAGHYSAGNDIRKYPDNIIAHALTAPPVEVAFDQSFKDAFVSVARQFLQHFQQRGWTQTDMQCYQNNKYYYKDEASNFRGTSWWLLDEPMHRDDWLALRFFARLFREGAGDAPHFIYRADISRPQWQRDWLDGLVNLMCVSSELFAHPQHCRRFRDQGVTLWHYGTANSISATNLNGIAWALKAWCAGADGILPWNSIGGDRHLDVPEATALLVPGNRFGLQGPVVSLRVLALCRGEQDVEYLNLLAKRRGYDRDQMARLVSDFVALAGTTRQNFADHAGQLHFERLTCEDFARLRSAVAAALQR